MTLLSFGRILLLATFLGFVHAQVANVTYADRKPDAMICNGAGAASSSSWAGTCASRGYTFTPQCILEEKKKEGGVLMCMVSYTECGCMYWEEGADMVSNKLYNCKKDCDPCPFNDPSDPTTCSAGVAANGLILAVLSVFSGVLFM